MIARIIPVVLVVLGLLGLVAYSQYRPVPQKVSGFLEADDIRVGSRVGGRVARVHVEEGQRVERGQLLVELEPFDLLELEQSAVQQLAERQAAYDRMLAGLRRQEVDQALARYDQLKARVELLENGPRDQEIEAARAQLVVAKSTLNLAQQNHERVRGLFDKGAATQEMLDRAVDELQAAQARSVVRQQELSLLEAGTRREELEEARAQRSEAQAAWDLARSGYRQEDTAAAKAARDAAAAALAAIRVRQEELRIASPVDGAVEAFELRPGDLTAPPPVLTIVEDRRLWVRAYVPETR